MNPMHPYASAAGIILAVSMAAHPGSSLAQELPRPFNIPAGPATDSIPEFARQAGINILTSADILDGVNTEALSGSFAISEAVDRLLACTNLVGRVSSGGTVVILARPPGSSGQPNDSKISDETMTNHTLPGRRKATCVAVSAAVLMMGAPLSNAQEQAPGGGEDDRARAAGAVEEGLAHGALEGGDLLADRRLGAHEDVGGPDEGALLGHGAKGEELGEADVAEGHT